MRRSFENRPTWTPNVVIQYWYVLHLAWSAHTSCMFHWRISWLTSSTKQRLSSYRYRIHKRNRRSLLIGFTQTAVNEDNLIIIVITTIIVCLFNELTRLHTNHVKLQFEFYLVIMHITPTNIYVYIKLTIAVNTFHITFEINN